MQTANLTLKSKYIIPLTDKSSLIQSDFEFILYFKILIPVRSFFT
jgi:hypothetical protein